MDETDLYNDPIRRPTGNRPLLGQTVLVVEDSRFVCDAIRLLCLRSGARIRRADCLKSARRHLQIYRPSVLIIDVGLPDGSGTDLIEEAVSTSPRVPVVLGCSGDTLSEGAALAAGADGFLSKPIVSLAGFQTTILSLLPADRRPVGPYPVRDEVVHPDPVAYRDDMAHVAEVLTDAQDDKTLGYVAQFLKGVAISAADHTLERAAIKLSEDRAAGRPLGSDTARIAGLVQERLQNAPAI
ncbi:MAG: response regulator [Paracoccaceae bacterium]